MYRVKKVYIACWNKRRCYSQVDPHCHWTLFNKPDNYFLKTGRYNLTNERSQTQFVSRLRKVEGDELWRGCENC